MPAGCYPLSFEAPVKDKFHHQSCMLPYKTSAALLITGPWQGVASRSVIMLYAISK